MSKITIVRIDHLSSLISKHMLKEFILGNYPKEEMDSTHTWIINETIRNSTMNVTFPHGYHINNTYNYIGKTILEMYPDIYQLAYSTYSNTGLNYNYSLVKTTVTWDNLFIIKTPPFGP